MLRFLPPFLRTVFTSVEGWLQDYMKSGRRGKVGAEENWAPSGRREKWAREKWAPKKYFLKTKNYTKEYK